MRDRIGLNEDGTVDDVTLEATGFRIEDLGGTIWIAAYRADGDRFAFEVSVGEDGKPACRMTESSVGSLRDDGEDER